jgi:peroxiredoxin (alkyl hydroperoxide reductase subunit C)
MTTENNVNIPGVGQMFPELSVQTTGGNMNLPDDLEGKWFLFFSHPADFTPVCTSEFVSFARAYDDFKELDCEIVGYSQDNLEEHKKWLKAMEEKFEIEIPFSVIADPEKKVAACLGLFHPCNRDKTLRATYLVDPAGKIRLSNFYPPELGRGLKELLRVLKGLRISDKHEVALPADWPNNRDLGGDVMISPQKAKEGKDSNVPLHGDWWFCHRKL